MLDHSPRVLPSNLVQSSWSQTLRLPLLRLLALVRVLRQAPEHWTKSTLLPLFLDFLLLLFLNIVAAPFGI